MAQKVQVLLTCDLDDDDTPAVETVTFGFDGYTYAFELCEAHLEEFNNVMQGYIASARRADGGSRRPRPAAGAAARPAREDLSAVREWARENGYEISDRGRIPGEVREAYEAAHKGKR
ncbi:Lsr2 family protein [Acidiferrimicrobium sp. IK]|uniref:histone-like nucleoid-structuring protein Lsr2 n=1 Tax=Acidiferrimicrobium sp. IK TaxID=2871700 RepID=UPI0021CAF5A7|nr:Lsr2 family protein [Acidiferrimicrobium sp. IK]MCU4183346.1 Lsr2 family protein [Acidiferrimicrobium sp. IK]